MVKLSRYTQELCLPDGNLVLANLLWNTFVELTPAEQDYWTLIKKGVVQDGADFAKRLTASRILISDDFDELEFMRSTYRRNRHSPDVLGLTIAPTIDCNLACIYCYENKRRGMITPEVEQKIKYYVADLLPGRKKFNVIWYGGEPLLCKDVVLSLSEYFRDRSRELNVTYSAQMTTNAMLLSLSVAHDMASIGGWTRVQITIDGSHRYHNARRPAKGGQGTFGQIYANLVQAVEMLPISLRMNVDAQNMDGCLELLEKLASDMEASKLHVYFSPVHLYGKGCRDIAENGSVDILDHKTFSDQNLILTQRARELGFKTDNALRKSSLRQCQAVSTHSIIVEPDGGLQRCWTEVGDNDRRIGDISAPVEIDATPALRWLRFDPTTMEPCRTCEVLPSCFGGCPQRHLDSRPVEMICAGIRFNTKAVLLADYIASHRPDLIQRVPPITKARALDDALVQISPQMTASRSTGRASSSSDGRLSSV